MSEIRGIAQSDIIIREGLLAGLADLRANAWVLDHAMHELVEDTLTSAKYGQKVVDGLKNWFLGLFDGPGTGIKVLLVPTLEDPTYPCITVELLDSNESENKLADLHADVVEDDGSVSPILAGPMNPAGYTPSTGYLVLPEDFAGTLSTAMAIVDARGVSHPILDVEYPSTGGPVVKLTPWTVADFTGLTVRPIGAARGITIETAAFNETYRIGCHATSLPHLGYLHTIVMLILLRGRESFFEARGLARMRLRVSPLMRNEGIDAPQHLWSRVVTVEGVIEHTWPKSRYDRIWSVQQQFQASAPGTTATGFVGDDEDPWLSADPLLTRPL